MKIGDNVVLVTGGASGLGGATARMVVDSGGKVLIADVNADLGEQFAAQLGANAKFVRCDVTGEPDAKAAVDAAQSMGRLVGLVNCAGIGPAVTFLFFAPAANILALVYTGNIIGPDLAVARLLLSLAFGIGIGLAMALLFHRDDAAHDRETDLMFAAQDERGLGRAALAFMLLWVALLLAGTLKLGVLAGTLLDLRLPLAGAADLQAALDRLVPYDAARGEEGVSVHGLLLIALLLAVGFASWRGFERIQEGWNRWTGIALGLAAATLLIAALRIEAGAAGLAVAVTGRFAGVLAALLALAWLARNRIGDEDLRLAGEQALHPVDLPPAVDRGIDGGVLGEAAIVERSGGLFDQRRAILRPRLAQCHGAPGRGRCTSRATRCAWRVSRPTTSARRGSSGGTPFTAGTSSRRPA